jgi:hypothetical protein
VLELTGSWFVPMLRHIAFGRIDQQFTFQEFSHFHDGVIVFTGRFAEFAGIDRYAGVNIVVKGEDMALVQEIPHQGIEVIGFLGEFDVQVIGEDIGDFVEAFQSAIIVYNGFGAAEIGSQR